MNTGTELLAPENLPLSLGEQGTVIEAEIVMPGVYDVIVEQEETQMGIEAFIVLRDASDISDMAKQYGQAISEYPSLLLYREDDTGNPRYIIRYELFRYRILHKLPLSETESIREVAVFGAELYPDYFGHYPVPTFTPWGRTTRHKTISNGLYWLETEYCRRGLAVVYPKYDDLSDGARGLAARFDDGLSFLSKQEPGYLFFQETDSSVPLFELISVIPETRLNCQIRQAELMNNIYQHHPEYVALHNIAEQSGLNDGFGLMLNTLGVETELSSSITGMVNLSPRIGTEFIAF